MEKYIEKVKEPQDNYFESCFEFAKNWLNDQKGTFTSEDVRAAYAATENPQPREARVWGAVFRMLSNNGVIVHNGFVKYRDKSGHGKPSSEWKKREIVLGNDIVIV
jgi:tRNA splicing endonuclease